MERCEVTGTVWTADPATGSRTVCVIETPPGPDGAEPRRFTVDGGSGRAVEAPARPHLDEQQVLAIVAAARQAEREHGGPREVSWAMGDGGRVRVLDSRPMHVPYPLPATRHDDLRVYFCLSVYQGVLTPLTPMGLAALRVVASSVAELLGMPVADRVAGPSGFVTAGQRMFVDITAAVRSRAGRQVLGKAFAVGEARSATELRRLTHDPRLSVVPRSRWPLVRGLGHLLVRGRVPGSVLGALVRPAGAALDARARLAELDGRWTADPAGGAVADLDHVESVLGEVMPVLAEIVPKALLGYGMLGLAGLLSGTPKDALQAVLRSLPNNPTTEMGIELWELGRRIRANPAARSAVTDGATADLVAHFRAGTLAGVAQQGIAAFLNRHGRRAVVEIDVGAPRWSEDPAALLAALRAHVLADEGAATPGAAFAQGAVEAQRAVEEIVARAGRRRRWRAAVVRYVLQGVRELAGLRELPKYGAVLAISAARQGLLRVGRELTARGLLADPADVFHLDLAELRIAARNEGEPPDALAAYLAAVVAHRRSAFAEETARPHVPRFLLSDGTEPAAATRPAPGRGPGTVLDGAAASAGVVTGRVRIVLDPATAHLEPGDVLVSASTNPGWTPLFLTAAALVTEMGGPMSHGAVVAREYGIPAVVGVCDAIGLLTDGELVTVDGGRGTVHRHGPGEAGSLATAAP